MGITRAEAGKINWDRRTITKEVPKFRKLSIAEPFDLFLAVERPKDVIWAKIIVAEM